ncbi:MAG: hypothetical protein KDD44_12835, partial [Bdellovibrionales bacterium]|nr:hypothetical protein [Bdellovibrionales bacterium]
TTDREILRVLPEQVRKLGGVATLGHTMSGNGFFGEQGRPVEGVSYGLTDVDVALAEVNGVMNIEMEASNAAAFDAATHPSTVPDRFGCICVPAAFRPQNRWVPKKSVLEGVDRAARAAILTFAELAH